MSTPALPTALRPSATGSAALVIHRTSPVVVYLDTCCLNRPFDDLSIDRNRREGEAFGLVLEAVADGRIELVWSEAIELECSRSPDRPRAALASAPARLATRRVGLDPATRARATAIAGLGFSDKDSVHLASAEFAGATDFLTTDDRLEKRARRYATSLGVRVINPVTFASSGPGP